MIVDFHTHIFPPEVVEPRQQLILEDATFRLLYENPKASLASSEDLCSSMDEAGIDVSVALGFAWRDMANVRLHNDYLIEAARESGGRIVPFCTLPLASGDGLIEAEMRRCVEAGARGFGELRPDNLGFDLDGEAGERLAILAQELNAILLFHVSEPVGHAYPGKEGLDVGKFYRFASRHPGVKAVGAHWGGGLPFYTSMPEVRETAQRTYVDTAASSLLYDDGVYERGSGLAGAGQVLFGSDFPLLSQKRSKRRIEESGLDEASKARVLGENAAKLLELP